MKKTAIASLLASLFSTNIHAADNLQTEDVVVTATRFSENTPPIAANISIITKQDFQDTPAISIPDILKTRADINVVPLYGNQGIDASADIRGFGDSAGSNTLVLLDGQRLNSVDSSNIQWAAIPMQALERIEIIRGGGSVLYGDRASGGVINLITDKSGKPALSATATVGSYGYKSLDGYAAGGNGEAYFNTFLHSSDSNGWRENSKSNQLSLSGRGGVNWDTNEAFMDYSVYHSGNGLPGSINSETYRRDPREARTPDDFQTKEGYRLRPGVSMEISQNIRFNGELAFSDEDQHFNNASFSSTSDRNLKTISFTPRLRWQHGLGSLTSETVTGFDYYNGRIASDYSSFVPQDAKQISKALYLQNLTSLNEKLDLNFGLRTQNMQQHATQATSADPLFLSGASDRTRSVYDLGLNYHEQHWGAYTKIGSSFRFANTDELFGFDSLTGNPVFAGDIKPQYGRNKEIGVNFKADGLDAKVAAYRSDITDEIGYDGNKAMNVNFDPTRHQGIEAELSWQISHELRSMLAYAYTDAEFRSGVYDGKRLPSVPQNKATAQLTWVSPGYGRYAAQLNYVGSRYVSGDFTNTLNKLPSYTTVDLRAGWDVKPLKITLTALNIFDKKYSPYALYALDPATGYTKSDYFFFPADGRSAYLSVGYDFW